MPAGAHAGENLIDVFIRAHLAGEGLKPSPEADATTLVRRVFLDLVGLPASSAEVEAFVKGRTGTLRPDGSYEQLVDHLLESPHYGERRTRWWLDQARYADSNGYSIDAPRIIWPWRDWVVTALNTNMPFDQFTIEQTVGDLLPDATIQQKVATGFHRNTQVNGEGGIDPEPFRVDRVGMTGTVWLGLTVGCAQCHDHKFDPLSQKEFYQLFAFFNGTEQDGHGGTKTSTVRLPAHEG